jgi:hypothetical protein
VAAPTDINGKYPTATPVVEWYVKTVDVQMSGVGGMLEDLFKLIDQLSSWFSFRFLLTQSYSITTVLCLSVIACVIPLTF